MKPLSTGIYTFSELIGGGYQYVDKTAFIYRLVEGYKGQYFLSRPRRFGKSLLISTLKSIFLGQRELFDGLAIDRMDYDWDTYPVIHLDMGPVASETVEGTKTALREIVDKQADRFEVKLTNSLVQTRFQELIEQVAEERPVVILIDEYDKPLLGHIGRETAGEVQRLLKRFYSVVKTTEPCQRFVLLTGVTKFSKVSVFSDLNNLTDLTMQQQAATMLGYTQEELEANFSDYIDRLAEANDMTREKCLGELRDWYNGYRFEETAEAVYNPVSVMKCFMQQKFENYWFETGTPTFLMELLKRRPLEMGEMKVMASSFSAYDADDIDPLPLLVQTGYLTIKDMERDRRRRRYILDYPNYEIEESFNEWLAQHFCDLSSRELTGALDRLVEALEGGQVDDMLEHLKIFFAGVPNTITVRREKYYQTIFYTVFQLIGAQIQVEVSTNIGRIDATVETEEGIFIFEFKLRGTAREALEQIRERQYPAPYRDDPRTVTLVGVSFDSELRNIEEWIVEPDR